MKRIEMKVIRMPSGKYLCNAAWDGIDQTLKLSQAIQWYGEKGETDPYEIAHDWGGKVVVLREDEKDERD